MGNDLLFIIHLYSRTEAPPKNPLFAQWGESRGVLREIEIALCREQMKKWEEKNQVVFGEKE